MLAVNEPSPHERLWKVKDVMTYLGVSRSWVYQHAETDLPALHFAGNLRFDPDQVKAYARGELKARTAAVVPLRSVR